MSKVSFDRIDQFIKRPEIQKIEKTEGNKL